MKNGRFSEKKIGNRWLTSTWKASLSTWLKSGLTVASSVIVDESPHFALMPKSPSASASPHSPGATRSSLRVNTADGISSRVGRGSRFEKPSLECFWNTHEPGSSAGHDTDTPVRLMRRQKRIPICTSAPPPKRIVWSGKRISTV